MEFLEYFENLDRIMFKPPLCDFNIDFEGYYLSVLKHFNISVTLPILIPKIKTVIF